LRANFDQRGYAIIEGVNAVIDPVEFGGAKAGGEYTRNIFARMKTELAKASSITALKAGDKALNGGGSSLFKIPEGHQLISWLACNGLIVRQIRLNVNNIDSHSQKSLSTV
jgi:hypothetical protein